MSSETKKKKDGSRGKIKSLGDHTEFLKRITKTLYYGKLPTLPCLSLPVTEISCALWSSAQRGRSLRRLHADAAAALTRRACVSPCALVLAVLYLERLQRSNPRYLAAAAPHDLFLVSLMVSNKFLQDDGEDDEVYCSEWAASGGLDLNQLKKLEVEFLDAIDWKIFVSESSFEAGLQWLERQVALREARRRGFFSYCDLAAAAPAAPAALLAAGLAALSALSALSALLAYALLVAQVALPSPPLGASTATGAAPSTLHAPATTRAGPVLQLDNTSNDTFDRNLNLLSEESSFMDNIKCCYKWSRYRDEKPARRNWYDSIVLNDWKSLEPWWSKTSVLNWLYQSSLINHAQRWLDKINQYATFYLRETYDKSTASDRCNNYAKYDDKQQCVRQWLNLSRLSMYIASVSDR